MAIPQLLQRGPDTPRSAVPLSPTAAASPVPVRWHATTVDKAHRQRLGGHASGVIWLTGLSGAGKSTLANELDKRLFGRGVRTYLLDGDNLRHGLNRDLGFSAEDRAENIRRVAEVSRLMVDAGLVVITAFISPFRAEREFARGLMAAGEFIEVYVNTPLVVAEQRDPKGLYKKARRGELKQFTGIDSPYEVPERPEIVVDTTTQSVQESADSLLQLLITMRFLDLPAAGPAPHQARNGDISPDAIDTSTHTDTLSAGCPSP